MFAKSATNPNHHLWNNHGTWWAHATVLRRGVIQERIRRSLQTSDVREARRKRDAFLRDLAMEADVRLSFRVGKPRRVKVGEGCS